MRHENRALRAERDSGVRPACGTTGRRRLRGGRGRSRWEAADGAVVEGGRLPAPVVPTGVLCIGLNYRKRAEE